MSLLDRLDKTARDFDSKAKQSLMTGYNQHADDMRELLQEAAARIRKLDDRLIISSGVITAYHFPIMMQESNADR